MPPLLNIALSVLLIGCTFTAAGAIAMRRFGTRGLGLSWLGAATALALAVVVRSARYGPLSPLKPNASLFVFGLLLVATLLGPPTIVLYRDRRGKLSVSLILAGGAASFLGLGAAILVGFFLELSGLPSPHF